MTKKKINNLDIGIKITKDILDRFKNIDTQLKLAKDNPIVLLEENLFLNKTDLDFFMNSILFLLGEEYLEDFQVSFTNKIISAIKTKISYDDVHLNIEIDNEGYYYILLSTIIDENVYPILQLNPYLKEIRISENKYILNILNEIELSKQNIIELENTLQTLELSKTNPLYLSGDNSIKMMDMIIRKKKYQEDIAKEMVNTYDLISQYNYKISQHNAILDEIDIDMTKCSIISDKYIDRLTKYYGYNIISNKPVQENIYYGTDEDFDLSQLDFSENPL